MITFDRITFNYGGEPIFDRFSMSVAKGDRVAVEGGSGSGKTTLLLLLLGFELPQSGTIRFEGEPVAGSGIRDIRRNAAWLPQDLNIGEGTVEEVMTRPFAFRANRRLQPDTGRMEQTLHALGLSGSLLAKAYRDLSTGQRQRVGLALCHLLDRPLLLLDEPTSALDRASKRKAAELLFSDPERTVVTTTHDPYWIERCNSVRSLD